MKVIVFFRPIMYTSSNIIGGFVSQSRRSVQYEQEEFTMKVARFVLKVVALSLAGAAAVCAIIAYWDKLVETCCCVKSKLQRTTSAAEYADYEE